jgi:hypothetical protein
MWTGYQDRRGYGKFYYDAAVRLAHRHAYEYFVGPIPPGKALDHLCRVTGCVRPDHLEPVTWRENSLRGNTIARLNANKTHCVHGHEYTLHNTHPHSLGWRRCRVCSRLRNRTYYANQRWVV